MPHIIVEYSQTVEKQITSSGVLQALHKAVVDTGLFSPEAVKARGTAYQQQVLPAGAQNFMHITTSILSGRSVEQRAALADSLFAVATEYMPHVDKISVDIHEMDQETYRK